VLLERWGQKKMAAAAAGQGGGDFFSLLFGDADWAEFEAGLGDDDGDGEGGLIDVRGATTDSSGSSFSFADIRNLAARIDQAQTPMSPSNRQRTRTVSEEAKQFKVGKAA
jgi:hypothetical protein